MFREFKAFVHFVALLVSVAALIILGMWCDILQGGDAGFKAPYRRQNMDGMINKK